SAASTLMWSISFSVAAELESASTSWQSAWLMSRVSAAPRRTGLRPTGMIPDIPAATNTAEKNGVFSSSTPTCGGRLGSSRARNVAATAAACRRWSRQLTNESSKYTPRSSTSTSGRSKSTTVGSGAGAVTGSGRGVRQLTADAQQRRGGPAQRELGLLGSQEVPMHRMVGVNADTAVDVNNGVRHPMSCVSGPECRGGDLGVTRKILAEPPGGLGQGEPQPLDIDVAVRQPLPHRLETT